MKFDLDITGIRQLRIQVDTFRAVLPDATNVLLRQIGEFGVRQAQDSPGFMNRTHKLWNSIGLQQGRDARGRFGSGFVLSMGSNAAFYAPFIEFGTFKITPRRTLSRAREKMLFFAEAELQEFLEDLTRSIRDRRSARRSLRRIEDALDRSRFGEF